jgi:hypothetical protein
MRPDGQLWTTAKTAPTPSLSDMAQLMRAVPPAPDWRVFTAEGEPVEVDLPLGTVQVRRHVTLGRPSPGRRGLTHVWTGPRPGEQFCALDLAQYRTFVAASRYFRPIPGRRRNLP